MSPERAAERKAFNADAAHWLNRNRSGEMSMEEVRAFQVWLERDPDNRKAYLWLEQLWAEIGGVGEDPAILKSCERDRVRFDYRARLRLVGAVAAGVMLVSVSAWSVATSGLFEELGLFAEPPVQKLRTSIGQRTTVTLRDNSVVTLDTDTVLRLHETRRERRVELVQGRAFFHVARDKSRPFIVVAAGRAVQATGTAFDVRVEPDHLQVTLVEGRVRVSDLAKEKSKSQIAEMRAGWRLDAVGKEPWRVAPVDVNKETAWHDGRLSFLNDPLAEAVAEMNRYSERKIVFRGAPPAVNVIGVFRAGDIDGFVRAVELNKLARVSRRGEEEIELAER